MTAYDIAHFMLLSIVDIAAKSKPGDLISDSGEHFEMQVNSKLSISCFLFLKHAQIIFCEIGIAKIDAERTLVKV